MSLSARERHTLGWIEAELESSDPTLNAMLAAFTMLTADEGQPGPETSWAGQFRVTFWRRREARPRHRRGRGRDSS